MGRSQALLNCNRRERLVDQSSGTAIGKLKGQITSSRIKRNLLNKSNAVILAHCKLCVARGRWIFQGLQESRANVHHVREFSCNFLVSNRLKTRSIRNCAVRCSCSAEWVIGGEICCACMVCRPQKARIFDPGNSICSSSRAGDLIFTNERSNGVDNPVASRSLVFRLEIESCRDVHTTLHDQRAIGWKTK